MTNFQIARNIHGLYAVPKSSAHRPAARVVLAGDVYEPDTLDLLCSVKGAVIHAGAYFGDFLPALAKSRTETVYAFEPNEENYKAALLTCELNNLKNVQRMNAALGSFVGQAFVQTHDDRGKALGGGSHLSTSGQCVPMVRLDDVVSEPIVAIHLDVEGYEAQALAGAKRIMSDSIPMLILETLPKDMKESYRIEGNFVIL